MCGTGELAYTWLAIAHRYHQAVTAVGEDPESDNPQEHRED